MREMKDSGIEWIGEIPADWTLQRGKTIFAQRLTKGNQSEILLAATQKYGMLPQSEVEGVVQVKEDADLQQFRTVHKKDFVISLRSFQGGFEYSQYEGVCSPAYQVFYNTNPICHNYYRLLFKSDGFIQKMNSMTVGIREGKNIQYSDFANSLIPVPPINQQQRIADYLDRKCSKIDAIIARQQEVIEKLKAYKLSVITEAVTKGLNPNVPMKDSGVEWIGEIPEHWSIVPLTKQLESIVDYRGKTPEKVDDGIFLVTARNIKNGMIDYSISSEYVKAEDYNEIMRRGIPQIGDVLFTTEAPLGQVANVDRTDIALAQRIIKFSTKKHLDSYFLKYWIMSIGFQNFLMTLSTGSTAVGIKASKLFMLPVPLVPMQEQNQIVTYLDKKCKRIESVIDRKQALIDKFTDYKKSLIYETVTGKKEV